MLMRSSRPALNNKSSLSSNLPGDNETQCSPRLDAMLKPESIAVVGASRDKPGTSRVDMFGQLVEYGYRGRFTRSNRKPT